MQLTKELSIHLSNEIKAACPHFLGAAVYAEVENTSYNATLWKEITLFTKELQSTATTESIKKDAGIDATRKAYKACGKDPSRYRPSNEALRRRLIRGFDLYQINTIVDLVNLVSLKSGYSLGGFDFDKIEGEELILGIGKKKEPYEGIGRGALNIEGMPVYRDKKGGIGTPTSDHERTKIALDTKHIVILINAYDGNKKQLEKAINETKILLPKYGNSKKITIQRF